MADRRRVSVELELEVAGYNSGAADAATVTRRVRAEIDELGDQADDTSRDMDQLALNTDVAASSVDELGDDARGTTAELAAMEAQLKSTARAAVALAAASALPGEPGGDVDRRGGGIPMFRLPKVDFSQFVAEARGTLITGLVAFLAFASPVIGGMIAGAVTGAVGLGGIAGGIAAAAKDPHVRQAAREFGNEISSLFFSSGSAFVGPISGALDILKEGFRDLDLESAFAQVAPHVAVVAQGIADMGRQFMPGFNRALIAAGPALQVLANKLPEIGYALGQMFAEMAESEGTLLGLAGLFNTLTNLLRWFGSAVAWLGDRLVELNDFLIRLSGAIEDLPGAGGESGVWARLNNQLEDFRDSAKAGAPAADLFAQSIRDIVPPAEDATKALDSLLSAIDDLIPRVFEFDEAQDAAANGIARLADQIKRQHEEGEKGAGTLDRNTQAGRDNADMVRDLVATYADLIVMTANAGGNTDALKQQLRDQLLQMGFNSDAVDYYVSQLDRIPAEKITQLMVENQQALAAIQETDRELRRLQDRTVTLTATYRADERRSTYVPPGPISPASSQSGEGRRALGGPVTAGEWYQVNEGGRTEFFRPYMSGVVMPIAPAGAGGGGQTTIYNTTVIGRPEQTAQEIANIVIRETDWRRND